MDILGRDTYEFENSGHVLERIEWDDLWFQEADNENTKRILFLGDSITRGFRPIINKRLEKDGYVADQLATSKSVDNPYFFNLVDYTISQQPDCEVIHILLGGHGCHLEIEDYEKGFENIITYLIRNYPQKKLFIANYHPFRKAGELSDFSDRSDLFIKRGVSMEKISQKYGIPFVDLYNVMAQRDDFWELYSNDGVHLTEKGYSVLADKVYSCIKSIL